MDFGLRYRPSLMSRTTASWIAVAVRDACVGMMDPQTKLLGEVQVAGASQTEKLQRQKGQWTAETQQCVHQNFEAQARRTPDAPAVWSWDGSWTYAELDRLASRLALHLKSRRVGPEVPVILCFEKSKWHVVASLAVLKAGGACVSVDPAHPAARLTAIAEAARAPLALCTERLARRIRNIVPDVIALSSELVDSLGDASCSCASVRPHNAAFIVFTSGSTGKPKGIVQEHGAFCWATAQFQPLLGTAPGRRVLQFAAYTFDISIVDTFITLTHGACLCIPAADERMNDLAGFVARARVNQACVTPAVARTLRPEDVPGLEVLCLAGEQLKRDNIVTWASKVRLLNAYGPAEVSVAVLCNASMGKATHPADTGKPIGGRCWIVSKGNPHQLVPAGAVGELLVEGPHVARGYLHEPEKTRAAFVEGLRWMPGRRLYRTGDMVRYQPDGSIYFVGRADSQVKVRGQRVELGEVEHQMYASGQVGDAVVLFPASGPLSNALIAVVSFPGLSRASPADQGGVQVLHPDDRPEAQRRAALLKDHLTEHLPRYMVPSTLLPLASFPFSASGKLDRKMVHDWLLSVDKQTLESAQSGDLDSPDPETETEMAVARAWSWVLNVPLETIRRTDSFLRLGGDSVSAMAVVSRCRQEGKTSVTVRDILQADSLRDVADRATAVAVHDDLPDSREEVNVPFALTPIQDMFLSATSSAEYSQSFLLHFRRKIDDDALRDALDLLVQRHSMLRARFRRDKSTGSWSQRTIPFSVEAYQLSFRGPSTLDDIYASNARTRKTLNIRTGPVFAATVFADAHNLTHRILFLTAHHLVIDLVSWRIILHHLESLLAATTPPPSPPRGLPFQTWARLQHSHIHSLPPARASQSPTLTYWNLPPATLPTFSHTSTLHFSLPPATTAALLGRACHAALATEPLDILLGVTQHAFAHAFPDRSAPCTFHTESHGRESRRPGVGDPSETVGWFTTMYPVVASGDGDVVEAVARAKDARRRFGDNGFAWFAAQRPRGPVELIFNYFGLYQQLERPGALFAPVNEREMQPTEEGGPEAVRMSLLEVDVMVAEGVLRVVLVFDRRMARQRQLRAFMDAAAELFEEVAGRLPRMERRLTGADAPLMGLDWRGLEAVVAEVRVRTGLGAADVEGLYPCTPMQEDLLGSQAKGLGYYDTRLLWKAEVKGGDGGVTVDVRRLASAWRQVCDRHALLRSVQLPDRSRPGRWLQVIAKDTNPDIDVVGGRAPALGDVLAAIEDDPAPDFNAARPRHRLKLRRTLDGAVVCQLDISHVLIDGAATEALMRDWIRCYTGTAGRQTSDFQSYVAFLQSGRREQELEYWARYTEGMPIARFPFRPDCGAAERRLRTQQVMRVTTPDLDRCCESHQVTPACIFRAAWALTLRRYVPSDDVVFGYLAHGRDVPVESPLDIVGPLVVTLPFRACVAEKADLPALLQGAQRDMIQSLGAQSVSWSEIERRCGRWGERPFDTLLNYRKAVEPDDGGEAELAFSEILTHDPMEYAVVVEIEQGPKSARVCFNYWEPGLTEAAISRLASDFKNVLEAVIDP
ncbi:hypothetical protein B0J12DRAFT_422204 [Macrophomina phaseolina]|uniref:Carrier domain-containing protein n=1 Tax=Macrophomina phaseolina TaxID=35725 RepID=A0ABQ8GGE9_9PEZI|nr:hypothetical protein B0J12DRAFT_422204 [Macrophomina phaseolina]